MQRPTHSHYATLKPSIILLYDALRTVSLKLKLFQIKCTYFSQTHNSKGLLLLRHVV